jgi:transcriptional repressor NrdR
MHCPFCNADKDSLKVIDSRAADSGRSIRRRRECINCGKRFTTYERIEENAKLTVVKKDGRRTPWDRQKILTGLERACFKRPVPESELSRIVDEVEEELFASYDREVPTTAVGQLVADKLRRVDQVAYVRFASVYRQFKTLEDLVSESQAVLDAMRYETPGQGRLFIEAKPVTQPAPPAPDGANGHGGARARRSRKTPAPSTATTETAGE